MSVELKARILNLSDAFRLASVLSKYVDIEKVNPQADAIDFISDIVDKISPEEYLHCVSLMTKIDVDTIKQEIALVILTSFIEGLRKNQIVSLIQFSKSLGL
jgi:hypothetical protein